MKVFKIKKSLFFLGIFLFLFIFVSCSNVTFGNGVYDQVTLRASTEELDLKTEWTQLLEATRLTDNIEKADGLSDKLDASISIVFASGKEENYNPVYPCVEGFSVIDTSLLSDEAKSIVNGFCMAVIKNEGMETYMAKKSLYSLLIFLYDIESQKSMENTRGPLFSDYLLGQPFDSDEIIQCPVRFFYTENYSVTSDKNSEENKNKKDDLINTGFYYKRHADINLYLVKEGLEYKISQIELR